MAGGGMMGWGGFGFGSFWWLIMLLFWVLVIGGVVLLVAALVRQAPASDTGGSRALEILRERYARGELTREQYEQMRRDLTAR